MSSRQIITNQLPTTNAGKCQNTLALFANVTWWFDKISVPWAIIGIVPASDNFYRRGKVLPERGEFKTNRWNIWNWTPPCIASRVMKEWFGNRMSSLFRRWLMFILFYFIFKLGSLLPSHLELNCEECWANRNNFLAYSSDWRLFTSTFMSVHELCI